MPQGVDSNITAQYTGDAIYQPFTSAAGSDTVNPGATVTVSAPNGGETLPDATVTFTVTVAGNGLAGTPNGSPTGQVELFEDAYEAVSQGLTPTPFGSATLSGSGNTLTVTANLPGITAGSHVITAIYLPDANSQYASVSTQFHQHAPFLETAQQAFAPGDLVVLRRETDISNQAGLVFLDEYNQAGTFVQTVILPDDFNGSSVAVTLSDKQQTEGALIRSANGNDLTVYGFNMQVNTGDPENNATATSVANINQAGVIDTSTSLTIPGSVPHANQTQPRSAVTVNGQQFWVVGNVGQGTSGIQYVADGTVGAATNIGRRRLVQKATPQKSWAISSMSAMAPTSSTSLAPSAAVCPPALLP